MTAIDLFVFRRDLRAVDNRGLAAALASSDGRRHRVLPVFVFSASQVDPKKNPYFSKPAFDFMIESLRELNKALGGKLACFYAAGDELEVFEALRSALAASARHSRIAAVHSNRDVTPYARARDSKLEAWCAKNGINFLQHSDYTLIEPGELLTKTSGKPYVVYTPFYRAAIDAIIKNQNHSSVIDSSPPEDRLHDLHKDVRKALADVWQDLDRFEIQRWAVQGGRTAGARVLDLLRSGEWRDYGNRRDDPADERGTTRASAYLKFGCISCREFLRATSDAHGYDHGLVREILWREFYFHLAHHFPGVLAGQVNRDHARNGAFKEKGEPAWKEAPRDERALLAWQAGRTGFPFVDAGMRQMNATGYMHNRLRMVVAMFLTKDLLLDWRLGERYFATKLVDYDPCQNNGGWQWSASTGADAAPYFRIFNPWLQSLKYDPDAKYIKKYVPELVNVPAAHLHAWHVHCKKYPDVLKIYAEPIVDHAERASTAKKMYANAARA